MNAESDPYCSHYGLVHGWGLLDQFYFLKEEKKTKQSKQRRFQRSVGCKCRLTTDKCGTQHGGRLFICKNKRNELHDKHHDAIREVLGVKTWGKNSNVCIRQHHFDQRVLDEKGHPYSYIHDANLAVEIYPDREIFERARVSNWNLWTVVPTKNTKVEGMNSIVGHTAAMSLNSLPPDRNENLTKSASINVNEYPPDNDVAMNSDNSDEGFDNYLSGNHLDQSQILDEDGDTNMPHARKNPPSLFLSEPIPMSLSNETLGVTSIPTIQNTMTASRSPEVENDHQWNPEDEDTSNNDNISVAGHDCNASPPTNEIIEVDRYATPTRKNEKSKRSRSYAVSTGFSKLTQKLRSSMSTIRKQRRKKTKTTKPSPILMNLANSCMPHETDEGDVLELSIRNILSMCTKKDGSIREEVNGLMIEILEKNMAHQGAWDTYKPIRIKYKKPDGRKSVEKCIACVPAYQAKSELPRKIARGAKILNQIVENMAGVDNTTLQQAMVLKLATNMGGILRWKQSSWLDVIDCMTLRERGGVSSTKIIEILQSAAKLLGIKNFCPGNLLVKFREEHLKRLLEVAYHTVDLDGKQCIMYWIKNQPLLVERLIASSIMDGTYQKSEEFCNIVDSEIILRGIDKGFEDISDLIRLVNRKDGNSGRYCIPICTVEDADETYANLEKTSFREEIGKLMNKIYADEFHLMSIMGESKGVNGAHQKDARCIMIAFKNPDDPLFKAHSTLNKIIMKTSEQHISLLTVEDVKLFKENSVHAKDNRDDLDKMEINLGGDLNNFNLDVQMVRVSFDNEEGDDEIREGDDTRYDTFIGCKVSSNGKELLSFLFDHPMELPCRTATVQQQFSGNCRKLKLFNCDDGKMTANTCGLRTCNSTFSCPCCIRPSASYSIEGWVEKHSEKFGDTVHILSLAHKTKSAFNHLAFRFELQCNEAMNYDPTLLTPKITNIDHVDILTSEGINTFRINSKKSGSLELIDPINLSYQALKRVHENANDTFELNVIIRMVRAKVERKQVPLRGDDADTGNAEGSMEEVPSYIGFKVISILPNQREEEISSIEFKSPIVATTDNVFGARFRQAISLHCSKENIMTNSIIGLKTCRSKPFVQPTNKAFREDLTKKLSDTGFQSLIRKQKMITYNFQTYLRREGDLSHANCYAEGKEILGKNMEKTAAATANMDKAITSSYSVIKKPLRYEDCNKFISDCLHAFEGMVTHLNETVRELLRKIDDRESAHESSWNIRQHLDYTLKRIQEERTNITSSESYKNAKKIYASNNQKVGIRLRSIKKERKKSQEDQDLSNILKWEQEMADFENRIIEVLEGQGLGLMNRKLRGCSELEKEVKERLQKLDDPKGTKKTKKPIGQSEFIFVQGIRSQAGKFNKQHGGLELTGAKSLLLLERRNAISRLMQNTYPSDPEKSADVKRVVDKFWLAAAEHLYKIGTIMKSQEKMDDVKLEAFENHLVDFLIIWLKYSSEIKPNPIYWKLHNMFCSVKDFATLYGMIGRVSAEGFENKHVFMRILKELMRPVIQTRHRVENISFRQQIGLLHPGVVKRNRIIEEQIRRTGKRGPYKNKGKNTKQREDISKMAVIDDNEILPPGYFKTESGALLPDSVSSMYNFLLRGLTPAAYQDPFELDGELGSKEKGIIKFLI